jgi:hypothetical protein
LQDVRFDTVAIQASPAFVTMYDAAVEVWSDTRDLIIQRNLHKAKRVSNQLLCCQQSFQVRAVCNVCLHACISMNEVIQILFAEASNSKASTAKQGLQTTTQL